MRKFYTFSEAKQILIISIHAYICISLTEKRDFKKSKTSLMTVYILKHTKPSIQSHQYKIINTKSSVQSHQYKAISTKPSVQNHQDKVINTKSSVQSHQYKVISTKPSIQSHQYKVINTKPSVQSHQYKVRAHYKKCSRILIIEIRFLTSQVT